jgi:CDP-glucose 4,6-dehydratase
VRRSYAEPAETLETNALGTMNVLEVLRRQPSVQAAVLITSDKCYRNLEWTWGYREIDALGGGDPYSASKACAELICRAYYESYFQGGRLRMATARAGNVIGGGDWAPDRLVPDCVRAWSAGQAVQIRHPRATRPWQHVLEPLSGYLWLGARLWQEDAAVLGEAFNFGPSETAEHPVSELLALICRYWPQAAWKLEPVPDGQQRESTLLKLCCDKAWNFLKWRALLPFEQTIRLTAEWYRSFYQPGGEGMYALTGRQIDDYQAQARAEGLAWALS